MQVLLRHLCICYCILYRNSVALDSDTLVFTPAAFLLIKNYLCLHIANGVHNNNNTHRNTEPHTRLSVVQGVEHTSSEQNASV